MSTSPVQWIKSTSPELSLFGLPAEIPWPAEVDPALASATPFELEHLIRAVELLGPEAPEPWKTFLASTVFHEPLAEALEHAESNEAMAALEEIEKLTPDTAFVFFHRAQLARLDGSDEDALELFRAAAERAPSVAPIWSSIGSIHALRGERAEAITAFRTALKYSANDQVALEGLTTLKELVKLRAADPAKANVFRYVDVPAFRSMAEVRVQSLTDPAELIQYAEQLLADGNAPEAALHAAERAAQLAPSDARYLIMLANGYRATGRFEEARQTLLRFIQLHPQEPIGHLHLASTLHGLKDEAGERTALAKVLELDPNSQPALAAHFRLTPGEHDPKTEDALSAWGTERSSWMAHILASEIARTRGDKPAAFRHAEHAMELHGEGEEVLCNYAVAIGDMKELPLLTKIIKPAVSSGKYSLRLNWTYANVLRQMHLTGDAVGVLRQATKGAPEDFQKMANTTIDAWIGLVTGCGVRLETHPAGFLPRPVVIALPEGDGGLLIGAGATLPSEMNFPWRASGDHAAVSLQQGETGPGKPPLELGVFIIRNVKTEPGATQNIDCHLIVLADGSVQFRATQAGHKLHVGWTNYPGADMPAAR